MSALKKLLEPFAPKSIQQPIDDNHYNKARAEYDDRVGFGIQHAKNWRLIAVGLLVLSLLLGWGLIYQSSKSMVKSYVVEVDRSSGEVKNVVAAESSNFELQEKHYKSIIYRFIKLMRELSSDEVVNNNNYAEGESYCLHDASNWIHNEYAQRGPNLQFGKETQSVEIKYINRLSEKTYRAVWAESRFKVSGDPIETVNMSGIFTMTVIQGRTEEDILHNPLGIYIENVNWTRELQ